jgi:hypothetical protein
VEVDPLTLRGMNMSTLDTLFDYALLAVGLVLSTFCALVPVIAGL